ncbi:hypothetical protein [Parasitella parasitica]|uniref:Endonuclease/exonuclease/phosphatase domain-containing protein n=1 Tax=Parasitella parasitica TaxID=35722 RepID=A0A0B7N413_9FUNG|nr:hypothetical protein [Parasitella parasitica]
MNTPLCQFIQQLLTLPIFNFSSAQPTLPQDAASDTSDKFDPTITPMLILGDFNYNLSNYSHDISDLNSATFSSSSPLDCNSTTPPSSQERWQRLLMNHFFECTRSREDGPLLPTFRRGNSQSTIDYIFASPFLHQHLHSSDIQFMAPKCIHNALLRARFGFNSDRQGPGLWRANPHLDTNQYFINTLHTELDSFYTNLDLENTFATSASIPISSPQETWDTLNWRARLIKRLQQKRKRLIKRFFSTHNINDLIQPIEEQISSLQSESAQDQALRAGKHWREQGETSAGYLKRTIVTRAIKRSIEGLFLHPDTNTLTASPVSMHSAAFAFYGKLFSPAEVDENCIQQLCQTIPDRDTINESSFTSLERPLTIINLREGVSRTSLHSSPGVGGIPYAILQVVFQHNAAAKLAVSCI